VYDQFQAEAEPRLRRSPFLLSEFSQLEVDTAAAAYFLRQHDMPSDRVGISSIELTADKQYDRSGNPVLGEYFPGTHRTAVHMSMIAGIGKSFYRLSGPALDCFVSATASATLAHELKHAALGKNPAMRAAERRFMRHAQLRTGMVHAGGATMLVQTVGTFLLETPSAVPAGLLIAADILALRYFQRYRRDLPQALYTQSPEEIVCRAVEVDAPQMVKAVVRQTQQRAKY
jgi:hypothetical protein